MTKVVSSYWQTGSIRIRCGRVFIVNPLFLFGFSIVLSEVVIKINSSAIFSLISLKFQTGILSLLMSRPHTILLGIKILGHQAR